MDDEPVVQRSLDSKVGNCFVQYWYRLGTGYLAELGCFLHRFYREMLSVFLFMYSSLINSTDSVSWDRC